MVGQIISNYEPSMAMEGTTKSDKPENTLILRQVSFIIKLGNLTTVNKYKKHFINAVLFLDDILIIKGRDTQYLDAKDKLKRDYNIGESIEELDVNKRTLYCRSIFKEQLAFINRTMEKDVWGGLDIDDEKLAEQEELDDASEKE